jgi:hypothetical protein
MHLQVGLDRADINTNYLSYISTFWLLTRVGIELSYLRFRMLLRCSLMSDVQVSKLESCVEALTEINCPYPSSSSSIKHAMKLFVCSGANGESAIKSQAPQVMCNV